MFSISVSGSKAQAIEQVNKQVYHPQAKTALHSMITAAPGSHVSISGSMTSDSESTHGTLALSGSFWTPKA